MTAASAARVLGTPTSRVEGRAKVTGAARYAAEHNAAGLAHGFVVSATIAKGRIKRIHIADALAVDGVLDVFTHAHRPQLASADKKYGDEVALPGKPFRPLYDEHVRFSGQPVALVVAEEPEIARFAASLVRIDYEQEHHVTDFEGQRGKAAIRGGDEAHVYSRGNAAKAFAQAPVRIEAAYRMPVEHHNAMETFGATAVWEDGGRITVHDKTQGPQNCRDYVANVFDLRPDDVRVLCLMSAAHSGRACVRNTSCRWPCWPRARSSAPCRWP